jgi:hypothetical protein
VGVPFDGRDLCIELAPEGDKRLTVPVTELTATLGRSSPCSVEQYQLQHVSGGLGNIQHDVHRRAALLA